MKIVIEILHSVYWWNPLIYKVFFPLVNQTQELFVDYSLTKNMSSDEKSSYMFTLTKTLRMQNTSIPTSVLYALADTSNNTFVRQRLECIMEPPQKQFSFLFSGGYLLLFLLSYTVTFQCAI